MDKAIVIETLKTLQRDILAEKFALLALRKKKKLLAQTEEEIKNRIAEKQGRIDYNLRNYGNLLK